MYVCMYVYIYIYIHVYIHIGDHGAARAGLRDAAGGEQAGGALRRVRERGQERRARAAD